MTAGAGRNLLFAVLLTMVSSAWAAAQELYLSDSVVVAGQDPTFGSVCIVTGGESGPALGRLLSSPLPELSKHPALVPARDLRKVLPKGADRNVVLVGGPLIYLPKAMRNDQERSFYTSLLQYIEQSLPERSLRVEVWAGSGQSPDMSGVHGSLVFQLPAGANSPQALIQNGYVQYKGENDPSFQYLPINVRIDELVPVARMQIGYGQPVSGGEVVYESRSISDLTGTPARVEGRQLQSTSSISRGSVIYADMVSKVLAITAGKQIRIAFRKGNVQVTVPGSAYQSGSLGDRISVAPSTTGTRFTGTIVSPTEVIVED